MIAAEYTLSAELIKSLHNNSVNPYLLSPFMADILILYSTTDGHTRKICEFLQRFIEQQDNRVTLLSIDDASAKDISACDKIVIGASIRYGKHAKAVYDFVREYQPQLDSLPNALFSVNLVARKPGRNVPGNNPYLKRFLHQIKWKPKHLAVFAGKLNYPKYDFWDRKIIQMIMWITGGPTNPDAVVEYTDWDQVEAFGKHVCEM